MYLLDKLYWRFYNAVTKKMAEEDGINTIELVVILVALVGLALMFKEKIVGLFTTFLGEDFYIMDITDAVIIPAKENLPAFQGGQGSSENRSESKGRYCAMAMGLLGTILSVAWVLLYSIKVQRKWRRKEMLTAAVCLSVLVSILISIGEASGGRALARVSLTFLLAVIAVIDYEKKIIPNHLQLHLAVIGLTEYIILFFTEKKDFWYTLAGNLAAGFGVFAILLLIALLSKGLGGGDVKLLGLLGCVCGYAITISTLFWALVSSALVSLVLLAGKKKSRKDVIPFGPFIWMGYIVSMAMLYRDMGRIQ